MSRAVKNENFLMCYCAKRLRSDRLKTVSLLNTFKKFFIIQTDIFAYRFQLILKKLVSLPSKSLTYTVIISYLEKLSTLAIVKFTTSTKTKFKLQTSVTYLRSITMCNTLNCGHRCDISSLNFNGNVFVQMKLVL